MPDGSPEPSFSIGPEIKAAMDRWEQLAALAWDRYLSLGRGALVVARGDLIAIPKADEAMPPLEPGYVPVDYVPPSDDFTPLMHQYDPQREFLLVVSDAEKHDMLLRMQSDGESRPTPEQCWAESDLSSNRE